MYNSDKVHKSESLCMKKHRNMNQETIKPVSC